MSRHTLKKLQTLWSCLALTPLTAAGLFQGARVATPSKARWGVRIRPARAVPPPPEPRRLPRRFSA